MAGKGYNAGSVNTKINLDTSEFNKAIEELKKKTEDAKKKAQESAVSTSNYIDNLKKSVDSLTEKQSQLYSTTENTNKGLKEEANNLKKLATESTKSGKNIKDTAKATAELNKELKKSSKQTQIMVTDLEKDLAKSLHSAISNAQKIAKGTAVALKPIFDEMNSQYGNQFRNIDDFRRAWLKAFRLLNVSFKDFWGSKLGKVPIGKDGFKFNAIDIKNIKNADELEKALKAVEETTKQITTATEKSTEANKKNIESTKQRIELNKKLATSMKQIDPKQQAKFTQELSDFLRGMADKDLGMGKTAISLKQIKKYFGKDLKDLQVSISQAVNEINATIKDVKTDDILFDITNLKKPIVDVAELAKTETKEVESEQKQLQKELQETESQIKKTANALQTQFSHYLYDKLKPHKGNQLFADTIVRQMKDMYSGLEDAKFDQLMYRALKDNGVKTKMLGSSEVFDLRGLTKPAGDLKEANEEIVNSTKKATEATKELGNAQLDLSGKIKYSYNELMKNYEQLPLKIQTALDGVSRVLYAHGKDWSAFLDYIPDVKSWGGLIPFLDMDQLLSPKDSGAYHTLGKFWHENEKYLKKYEKYVQKPSKKRMLKPDYVSYKGHDIGEIFDVGEAKYRVFDKYGQSVGLHVIETLKQTLKELQNVEIVSRKTGKAVKELGVSEEQTANKTKTLTNEMKQLVNAISPVSKKTSLSTLVELGNLNTAITQANRLSQAIDKVNVSESKTKDTTKQLGEATKYTAEQIKVMEAIFKEAQSTLNGTMLSGSQYNNKAPFKNFYTRLENEFLTPLTGMDITAVISPSKLRKRFQYMLKPLFEQLGIAFINEVPPAFESTFGSVKFNAMNFAGSRVGMYDATNLISEEEFNRLIGKTEELNVDLEGTSNQIQKAVTQANNLATAIQNVGAKAETSTNLVKKLGLATDEFGFVYLGELISNFERLPAELQKAVTNVARVLEKGHQGLYPKKGKSSIRDFQSYMSDFIFASFPISKAGIPFNANDPRYHSLGGFQPDQTGIASPEQLEEQKKLFDQILQTFGRFYPIEYKVVQGMERWGGNTRFVREELQYTLDTLEMMEPRVKSIARALDAFKADGLKFMTKDQWNSPYFLSKLLQEGNGFEYYSRIKPKNEKDRYYSPSDRHFLEKLMKEIFNPYIKGEERYRPIDAHHIFKYPAFGQLTTHDMINMPYGTDYIQHYKDGTKKEYEKFVKYAQTQMIRALKPLGITLSTELARTSEQGVRVWLDNIGKFRNMGSLDLSNMIRFDDFRSAMAYVDRLTNSMVSLGYGMDKTAMKTKQLSYALKENVNWQQRVNREQEKALIKAKKSAESKYPELKVGVSLWGTPEEFRNAELGFRNLIASIDRLGTAENKTTSSSKNLKRSLDDIIRDFHNLSDAEKVAITMMMELNKAWGSIDRNTIYGSRIPFIKQIGADLNIDVSKLANSIKLPAKQFNELAKQEQQLYRLTDEYNKSLIEKAMQSTAEIQKLSEAYLKVSESANYFGISAYQAYSNIIPAVIKAREELLKLGEAQKLPLKIMEMGSISGKAKSPLTYLNLFKGQIKNIQPYINQLESRATKAFEKIKKESAETSTALVKLGESGNIIADNLAKASKMKSPIPKESVNNVNSLVVSMERIPIALRKVSGSYEKVGESERKFERQTKSSANSIDRYYNNLFRQLHHEEEEVQRKFNLKPLNTRVLKDWDLWGDGIMRSGETLAHTTQALKTFDNTVLTTSQNIKEKLVKSMIAFREIARASSVEITENMTRTWQQAVAEVEGFEKRYTTLRQRMYDLSRRRGYWHNAGKTNTGYGATLVDQEIAKYGLGMGFTANGKYINDVVKQINENRSLLEASLMGKNGRVDVEGYSDYVARSAEITKKLELNITDAQKALRMFAEAIKLDITELGAFEAKAEGAIARMSQMAQLNERFAKSKTIGQKVTDLDTMLYGDAGLKGKGLGQITGLTSTLEHFSGLSNRHADALAKFKNEATGLSRSFIDLNTAMSKGAISSETYEKEIDKLTTKVQRLKAESQKGIRELNLFDTNKINEANNGIKQSTGSLREFGNEMSNGEKYANNLYRGLQKARSVIISIKTIGRMMGGMAVWNFAFDMVEQAKQTYVAKNEIESLLNKNSKVDASGIQIFNKALDDTVERFQKVNKYNLGETASSIGLEFNLSAKEMAKSLPIIAMIQSEYVRAGRTVEEAGLAVKDILQGEFMRLSRETGVGKEELIEAGWSGDNKDVISLMNALDKIGKARHWDLFAEKATSLNDVLTITKSRFAELGAEIGTTAEPLIVGAFNTILSAINSLKQGFEGLGAFGKNFVMITGGVAGIIGLSSAYLTLAKGMGAVDIATLGWTKSLFSNMLQLKRSDVAMHGFWKTLIATTSGVKTATVAELGFWKSLGARVLGLNQGAVAERGFSGAMVESISRLKEGNKATDDAITKLNFLNKAKKEGINVEKVSILSKDKSRIITDELINKELNRSQKLAYMTTNLKYAEVAEMGRGKALLKTATSARVLRTALIGLTTVSLAVWFASVASWTDAVKKRMESYYDILQNGKEKIKSTEKQLSSYDQKLSELAESDPAYELTKKNRDTVEKTLNDLKMAKTLADEIKKTDKETSKNDDLKIQRGLNALYAENGVNIEKQGFEYQKMKQVKYDMLKAEQEKYNFEYSSLQHIAEHVDYMKQAGISEEKRVKYITEYSAKAQEVAENLKKFNQGDLNAGVYALLGQIELYWIDLWNNQDFINFWESVKKTFEDLKPTLIAVKDLLIEFGTNLLRFFSSEQGRWLVPVIAFSTVIGGLAWKFRGVFSSLKTVFGGIKTLGGKLKDLADKWRNVKKEAEEANEKMGGKTPEETSAETPKTKKPPKDLGELGTAMKGDLYGNVRKYANYATQLAGMMFLMTEAIYLIKAPMWALAEVGKDFKAQEEQIRAGIEGLQVVAPTIISILIPVTALVKVFDHFGDIFNMGSAKNILSAVIGIAVGLGMVAEAIAMIIPSIWALGALGGQYAGLQEQVQKGTEAMKVVSESLQYLLPFVPALAGGILLGIAIFESGGLGAILAVAVAGGIALGLGLVAETILCLEMPLWSIGQIGEHFRDLSSVKAGAEAIKQVAEAMKDVSTAIGLMALVEWELLAGNIAHIINSFTGVSLESLTNEGGFFDQVTKFIEKFNSDELKVEAPNPEKVKALSEVGTGMDTISKAMESVRNAMDNLPPEFKNGGSNPITSYNAETGQTDVGTGSADSYFEQFKEPIKQLKTFIDEFNNSEELAIQPPDPAKVEALNQSASMLGSIKTAVENVKTAMGGMADAQWNTSMAEGGILSAVGNFLFHSSGAGAINNGQGSGDYKSSMGQSFQEMENVISDIFTFQSRVSGLSGGGEENPNVEGLAGMVTAVSNAIQQLQSTLSTSAPQVKESAKAIGTGIKDGVKEGMNGMGNDVTHQVVQAVEQAKPSAYTYGQGLGGRLKSGFKAQLKLKEATESEVNYTFQYLDGKEQEFYDKGAKLGGALARGYKEHGLENKSPGLMARTTLQEMYYIGDFIDQGMVMLPEKAIALGNALTSNFNPSFEVGGLSVDELSQFENGLGQVTYMANDANVQTTTAFANMNLSASTSMQGMTTSINSAFTGIQQNTTLRYNQLVNTTRVSLNNMLSQTTQNIGAIRASWRGMQNALIQSAENIRSETSSKISQLESNMASFWNKVQNPALLLGAGAKPTGTVPRRSGGRLVMPHTGTNQRIHMAGGRNTSTGIRKRTHGVSDAQPSIDRYGLEYLKCLLNGGVCAMGGGWDFNWSPDIKKALLQWHTHFGEIYDDVLTVGKFENDDFPVRGNRTIALRYIEDAIGQTDYEFYWDSKYGSPLEAWNAGHFNCVDGALVAIALANAFGFTGGYVGYGSWDGIGHGFAVIPGLGVIDATAIQNDYGLTSPKVTGYPSAGTPIRNRSSNKPPQSGETHNYGDVNLTINVYGDDVEVDEKKVDKSTAKTIIDLLGINPHTGQ